MSDEMNVRDYRDLDEKDVRVPGYEWRNRGEDTWRPADSDLVGLPLTANDVSLRAYRAPAARMNR